MTFFLPTLLLVTSVHTWKASGTNKDWQTSENCQSLLGEDQKETDIVAEPPSVNMHSWKSYLQRGASKESKNRKYFLDRMKRGVYYTTEGETWSPWIMSKSYKKYQKKEQQPRENKSRKWSEERKRNFSIHMKNVTRAFWERQREEGISDRFVQNSNSMKTYWKDMKSKGRTDRVYFLRDISRKIWKTEREDGRTVRSKRRSEFMKEYWAKLKETGDIRINRQRLLMQVFNEQMKQYVMHLKSKQDTDSKNKPNRSNVEDKEEQKQIMKHYNGTRRHNQTRAERQ
uniref:Uncharacterized protein n=1 Tax=Cacopsylla melanoneura TaxID=428564 RepID=A0A8D9B8D1_9HEMI